MRYPYFIDIYGRGMQLLAQKLLKVSFRHKANSVGKLEKWIPNPIRILPAQFEVAMVTNKFWLRLVEKKASSNNFVDAHLKFWDFHSRQQI
jgi:hypothetical protein